MLWFDLISKVVSPTLCFRDLFGRFGKINRIYLAKDPLTYQVSVLLCLCVFCTVVSFMCTSEEDGMKYSKCIAMG